MKKNNGCNVIVVLMIFAQFTIYFLQIGKNLGEKE